MNDIVILEKLNKLSSDIRKKCFLPVYFFYGNEYFFISKLYSLIKKSFNDIIVANSKIFSEENFDFDESIKCINAMPFLNNKKLIIFKNLNYFSKNDEVLKVLFSNIEKNIENNIVVIIEDESEILKEKEIITKYNKSLALEFSNKYGASLMLNKLESSSLVKYVQTFFQKENVKISKPDSIYIVNTLGNNLYNLYNECNKIIASLGGKKEVNRADIDKMIVSPPDDKIFKLIDNINSSDKSAAFKLYGDLISENYSPVAIFSNLSNSYTDAVLVKDMVENGLNLNEMLSKINSLNRKRIILDFQLRNIINTNKFINKSTLLSRIKRISEYNLKLMKNEIAENLIAELMFF